MSQDITEQVQQVKCQLLRELQAQRQGIVQGENLDSLNIVDLLKKVLDIKINNTESLERRIDELTMEVTSLQEQLSKSRSRQQSKSLQSANSFVQQRKSESEKDEKESKSALDFLQNAATKPQNYLPHAPIFGRPIKLLSRSQIVIPESDEDIHKLKEQKQELQEKLRKQKLQLGNQLEELQNKSARTVNLLRNEIIDLRMELDCIKEFREENLKLNHENQRLRNQIKLLKRQIERLTQIEEKYVPQLELRKKIEAERDNLAAELLSCKKTIEELEERIQKLNIQNMKLMRQTEKAETELVQKMQSMGNEVINSMSLELHDVLSEKGAQNHQLQIKHEEEKAKLQELLDTLANYLGTITMHRKRHEEQVEGWLERNRRHFDSLAKQRSIMEVPKWILQERQRQQALNKRFGFS